MNKSKILHKATENAYTFSLISRIIGVFTGLLYSILFSRYLGAEMRGEASIILNYSEMISLVLCFGIYQAYPYFKKTTGKDLYKDFINLIFGQFFLYVILTSLIAVFVDLPRNIVIAIVISPVLMGIKQLNYLVLIENPKLRNMASILLDIFDIIFLSILLVFTTANYMMCVMFIVVKQLVFLIIALANLRINIFSIRPSLKGILPYMKYGFIPMLTVILMEVNYKVDILMLERMGVATAEIGVYSLGVMVAQKIWMIPDALKDILLSKLAKGKTADEVAKITRICFAITVVIMVCAVLTGKPLIKLLYGAEYEEAYTVTLIILAGILGMVIYKMVYSYNVVNGHKNVNFIMLSIAAALNVMVNYITIPLFGTIGAAAASLVSYIICGISFLFYFCIKTKTHPKNMLLISKQDVIAIIRAVRE